MYVVFWKNLKNPTCYTFVALFCYKSPCFFAICKLARGTPALTYDIQGPSEYVVNNSTWWLAHTNEELEQRSVELWKEGYPRHMRTECLKEASKFDKKLCNHKWLKILDCAGSSSDEFLKIANCEDLTKIIPRH